MLACIATPSYALVSEFTFSYDQKIQVQKYDLEKGRITNSVTKKIKGLNLYCIDIEADLVKCSRLESVVKCATV